MFRVKTRLIFVSHLSLTTTDATELCFLTPSPTTGHYQQSCALDAVGPHTQSCDSLKFVVLCSLAATLCRDTLASTTLERRSNAKLTVCIKLGQAVRRNSPNQNRYGGAAVTTTTIVR